MKVITELLLLEVLLGEVLEVPLGEGSFCGDLKLGLVAGDGDGFTKNTSLAVYLDAVVEELLEGSRVEHVVIDRGGAVDRELQDLLLSFLRGGFLPGIERHTVGGEGAEEGGGWVERSFPKMMLLAVMRGFRRPCMPRSNVRGKAEKVALHASREGNSAITRRSREGGSAFRLRDLRHVGEAWRSEI
jgi:hypothetical protein